MAFDSFSKTTEPELKAVSASAHGTVLKPFNGPLRRFAVDYVVTDADVTDLPMSLEHLKARGFIA